MDYTFNTPKQTYSGTDIMVIFSIPITSSVLSLNKPFKLSSELQTLSISSTTSVLPVRRCGESRPAAYGKGGRTIAGSMVFVVTNRDPFSEIFTVDAKSNSMVNDSAWHIDQMPPFDIVISAQNESGGAGAQIIENARIVNWGTTLSVDDLYTEYTYSYVAENVTPFLAVEDVQDISSLRGSWQNTQAPKTPDDVANDLFAYNNRLPRTTYGRIDKYKDIYSKLPRFQSGLAYAVAGNIDFLEDPAVPRSIANQLRQSIINNNLLRRQYPGVIQ